MDYKEKTKEQLIERIDELEILNQQLLKEKEQETKLEYDWTGNLGHWYWNIKTNNVTFNPLKVTVLGYEKEEIPEIVSYEFFTDKLHPEDHEGTMKAMKDHLYGRESVYEAEYRIKTKGGKYRWYYDRGKITRVDEKGKPLFLAGIVFDITEKKEAELALKDKNKELAEISSVDGLTKISNRRALIEHLKKIAAGPEASKKHLSVAMFDMDDFKKINDTKGHVYGDKVLFEVAAILDGSIRDSDLAGRYGGEEFMVIFSDADAQKAAGIAERIRASIEKKFIGEDLKITVSGGIKQYQGEELTDLIKAADENLYKAKRAGKNQIVF